MARGLNKVMVIGALGRDPEMRYTLSGQPVTSFSVGATRTWEDPQGERHMDTEWFNVVAWGSLAELCKRRLNRGQEVYVEGRFQTRCWEDQQGQRCFRTELVANEMIPLEGYAGAAPSRVPHDVNTHGDAESPA